MVGLIKKQKDTYARDLELIVLEMFNAITDDYDSDRIDSMKDYFNVESNSEYRYLREELDPVIKLKN